MARGPGEAPVSGCALARGAGEGGAGVARAARATAAAAAATATLATAAEADGEAPPAVEVAAAAAAAFFLFLAAEFFWVFERFIGAADVCVPPSMTAACIWQGIPTQELLLLLSQLTAECPMSFLHVKARTRRNPRFPQWREGGLVLPTPPDRIAANSIAFQRRARERWAEQLAARTTS